MAIKLKRGLEATIPTLQEGEPGFTIDSGKLFIGTEEGNKEIGEQTPHIENLVEILWQDLVDLRDNGELVPGTFYRITDYVAPANSPIADDYVFDVIVLALSSSVLSENAQATHSERPQVEKVISFDNAFDDDYDTNTFFDKVVIDGDTYYRWLSSDDEGGVKYLLTLDRNPQEGSVVVGHQYIDNSTEELVEFYSGEKEKIVENVIYGQDIERVETWKLKYCLDNDAERFDWADDAETGLVYWIEKTPLDEIRLERHEFFIESNEIIQTGLKLTKEFLSTITIYLGRDGKAPIKVVDKGESIEGWDWDETDTGVYSLYDEFISDDTMLLVCYKDNENYNLEAGEIIDYNGYGPFDVILEEPIKNTKPYIFYKRDEVFTKGETIKELQKEKELLQFENDTLATSLDTVSETLYGLQQTSGNPIVLGTMKEPSKSGKIGKFSNSYIITPKRVVNGDFVEYHWDTSKWPFNEMVEVEEDGNVFIKVPKMYIKVVRDDNDHIIERYISDTKIDNDWLLPQTFIDHDAGEELDYFLTGKYQNSDAQYQAVSVSGKETMTNMTPAVMRDFIKANGTGYLSFDIHSKFIWETLYLIVFGNIASDEYFPQGAYNSDGAQNTGILDEMTHHTGYTTGLKNYLMKFMGVENLFSNVYTWVDGVKTVSGVVYVSDEEANYNSDNNLNNYYSIGNIATSGYISAVGSTQGLFSIPLETDGTEGKDFYRNYNQPNTGSSYTTLYFGRDWTANVNYGLFYWTGYDPFSAATSDYGSRLVKKPLQ